VNFDLDDEQRAFAATAREFFADQGTLAHARRLLDDGGTPLPGHKQLADLGFYGIIAPESAGGSGRQLIDLAVVAEEAGRLLAAPALVTAARAAVLLGTDTQRLQNLVDGSVAFAVVDGDAPAIDALSAEQFLALDGTHLVVGRGRTGPASTIDPTRGLAPVQLSDTAVVSKNAEELWQRARLVGTVVLAAEDLGAAAQLLDTTVAYVKIRTAFGRAIGSYQAVKHALAELYGDIEQLRSLVWWAAWAADAAPTELSLASSAAAACAARTLDRAAETAIHVHGGIGFTWEHDAHLYWRRAKVDRLLLGEEARHLDAVAELALNRGRNE
jgi:alkylation response protein AidB-like acyl-CoA dehydrogenase